MPKRLKNTAETLMLDTKSHLDALEKQMRREMIIAYNHKFSIWKSDNGRWQTYLPDETAKRKRRLISSQSKEKLEKKICEFYKGETPTFGEVFYRWLDRRLELEQIKKATYTKTECDFNRFCKDIEHIPINELTVYKLIDFMEEQIAVHKLNAKNFYPLKGLVKGTMNKAKRMGLITFSGLDVINEFNVMSDIKLRLPVKDNNKEVFTVEEVDKLIPYLTKSKHIGDLALLLMFATGMRVGEAVAIKHSDFNGMTVTVQRTEVHYRMYGVNCIEIQEKPKTAAGVRQIVIPSGFEWLVRKIAHTNPFEEYAFIGERGKRIGITQVQRRLALACDACEIPRKSTHKIRKTYLSILMDNNCDLNFITQQAGHTNITTTELYYHRDRKSVDEKLAILDAIPDFRQLSTGI